MRRSKSSPLLTALAVVAGVVFLVLVGLGLLRGSLLYSVAEHRWLLYTIRNNPRCVSPEECLSIGCPPPNGVSCEWDKGKFPGFCSCQQWGLRPEYLKPVPDAGPDGSR